MFLPVQISKNSKNIVSNKLFISLFLHGIQSMRNILVILVENCMKLTPLSGLKRSDFYKKKREQIILKSSRKMANRLLSS
jgi:hypothetical protein